MQNRVDLVFSSGPLMKGLHDSLPARVRGAWAEKASDIEAALFEALAPGDVVMVKGSNGSRMGPVVAAMKQKFARPEAVAGEGTGC